MKAPQTPVRAPACLENRRPGMSSTCAQVFRFTGAARSRQLLQAWDSTARRRGRTARLRESPSPSPNRIVCPTRPLADLRRDQSHNVWHLEHMSTTDWLVQGVVLTGPSTLTRLRRSIPPSPASAERAGLYCAGRTQKWMLLVASLRHTPIRALHSRLSPGVGAGGGWRAYIRASLAWQVDQPGPATGKQNQSSIRSRDCGWQKALGPRSTMQHTVGDA
jgi:hypothetical protein